ncbi:MAG: bacterial transcriptional activator domain-containing protein [Myxococcales bacterium]|nr:bacterial transcriptional activator domain-containing protein [Myxococcota bacterium]MDW8282950.1 bacterial transcriptional activator domain-containing protein [Myxococcales bacterium]
MSPQGTSGCGAHAILILIVAVLCGGACLLSPAVGDARPWEPPPLPEAVRATELTERAYELQRRGALNDAIRLYEEALRVDPLPKRHRNLAIPLEQAGRLVEALRQYWRFQRDERGEPPEHRADVAERVARLLPRLGRIRIAALSTEVPATVRVPAALAERPRCLSAAERSSDAPPPPGTPAEYLCEPGRVEVELLLQGRPVARRSLRLDAGQTAEVHFTLQAPVHLRSNRPRPEVELDGVPLMTPLPATVHLLLGPHVVVARDRAEQVRRVFTVHEGSTTTVELRFRPRRTWIGYVAGAAGLVAGALIVGISAYAATRPAPPGGADITLPPPM